MSIVFKISLHLIQIEMRGDWQIKNNVVVLLKSNEFIFKGHHTFIETTQTAEIPFFIPRNNQQQHQVLNKNNNNDDDNNKGERNQNIVYLFFFLK